MDEEKLIKEFVDYWIEWRKSFGDRPIKCMEAFLLDAPESPTMDWINAEKDRLKWSLETFTEATSISSLDKAKDEIDEIKRDIENNIREPEEYADALMCIIDSAGRHGIGLEEILESYKNKIPINKK